MEKFATLLLLFTSLALSCQNIDLDQYPELKIAEETSLYKDDVNWDEITKLYTSLINDGHTPTIRYEYLLNALGDEHGTFRNAKTFQVIAHYTGETDETRNFDSKFINEVLNDTKARFSHDELEGKIGYLKVVGIGPQFPMAEDAKLIQHAIAELNGKGVNKWVLDLRYNGGGNMNPMLTGLSALLGAGNIGGSSDKLGNEIQNYKIEKGKFYDSGNLVIDIENPIQTEITDKVAVLLSKYTVSSGEVVAVAFKGRENTRFFGERTRGKTTVTGFDKIDEETIMLISKAYYRDRNDVVYENGVEVDEKIQFEEFSESDEDEILLQSIKWLNNSE